MTVYLKKICSFQRFQGKISLFSHKIYRNAPYIGCQQLKGKQSFLLKLVGSYNILFIQEIYIHVQNIIFWKSRYLINLNIWTRTPAHAYLVDARLSQGRVTSIVYFILMLTYIQLYYFQCCAAIYFIIYHYFVHHAKVFELINQNSS